MASGFLDKKSIILDEDGPFAEYLKKTSQRLDNVRYENYDDAIKAFEDDNMLQIHLLDHKDNAAMQKEIDEIEESIQREEYRKCLLIIYTFFPFLIQPISIHQCKINDIISDYSYKVDSDVMHRIYGNLYSHFYDSDNEQTESKQSLFSSALIISNRCWLFFVLSLHSMIALSLCNSSLQNLLFFIMSGVEIMNILFVIIDIFEYFQWISFFNTMYELIHYLSEFQSFIDKSFKILNNVTAITNGYRLHHQFIASYKIEQKNPSNVHLYNLRNTLYDVLIDVNGFLYQITAFIANKQKNQRQIESKKEKLMLKDLLALFKHFRIHQKILFTQLYRICSPMIYANKLCKSIRSVWVKGFVIDNHHYVKYSESPFSAHQLRINVSFRNLYQFIYQIFALLYEQNMNGKECQKTEYGAINKFNALNIFLSDLSQKFRDSNNAIFADLRLSKKPKSFSRFSNAKVQKVKDKNISKMKRNMNSDDDDLKNRMNEIYNHLHKLQNKMDEITSNIYLFHEECVENPSNVIVEHEIKSKYAENENDIDIADEIEQYKSLEIMQQVMLGINRTFNEWKYIVSKINPESKLLQKYENVGFGYQAPIIYKRHKHSENVLEDEYDYKGNEDDIDEDDFKNQQKNVMSGLFAKLNKQRAKMSITEDGEELYEPTEETKKAIKEALENEKKQRDILKASMVKPGSGISAMDKYNMVDELKNVLKNRKKAAIKRRKGQTNASEEDKKQEDVENQEQEREDMKAEDNELSKVERMQNIRKSYPKEEVIGNYFSESSSDDVDLEEALNEELEKKFLSELNRFGLGSGALMTRSNTEISSFGYNSQRDGNTMSMFAMLQQNNQKEIQSVMDGTADDVEVEFALNCNGIEEEENTENHPINAENECEPSDDFMEHQSELQKEFEDQRSDDEGGTLADELGGLLQECQNGLDMIH